jgi:nucleoside-diphosphate-sugar epimerase
MSDGGYVGEATAVKCLVTGATGFIGQALCQRLTEEQVEFVALSRSGASLPSGIPTLPRDLGRKPVEDALLAGVDVVIHLAGIAHQCAAADAYEQVNHRATLDLAHNCQRAGVRCFIFVSSVKAMGPSRQVLPRDEQDGAIPLDAYGQSKWRAEQDLQREFGDSAMCVAIVRPALVYGEGARGNLSLLAAAVARGLPRPPDVGGRSMIALPDLVDVLWRLTQWRPPGVHLFIASDRRAYSFQMLYDLLRAAAGGGRARVWLPLWAWRVLCAVRDWLRPTGDEGTYHKLFGTELYDSSALCEALDWQPRLSLPDVIRACSPGNSDDGARR